MSTQTTKKTMLPFTRITEAIVKTTVAKADREVQIPYWTEIHRFDSDFLLVLL